MTGASGTVGNEVLRQLCENNDFYEITVFDKKTAKTTKKLRAYKNDIRIVYGDITNDNDINKISHNKDIVIHLAAIIPPLADENPDLAYQVNTVGSEKLIRSLEQYSPNAFFIYSSSIAIYGDRLKNPYININDELKPSDGDKYAITKIKTEQIIKNSTLDWTIFRLSAIMGGHKISKLMFHQPLETSLEIATIEDTARAFVNAIEKQIQLSKKVFNLGGGENCRIIYEDFLAKSFEIFGLGKLDFPPKTFADKNFHCGYYEDGNALDNILNFRKDSLNTYFEKEKQKISILKKATFSLFKKIIKKYLQNQSEPLAAYIKKDKDMTAHFFNSEE